MPQTHARNAQAVKPSEGAAAAFVRRFRDKAIGTALGAVLTVFGAALVTQYDNGFLARIMGATPKWRSIGSIDQLINDGAYFDLNCEYRFRVDNQVMDKWAPLKDLLPLSATRFYYPQFVSNEGLTFSYDVITLSLQYNHKDRIFINWRELDENQMLTGKIRRLDFPTRDVQKRCP